MKNVAFEKPVQVIYPCGAKLRTDDTDSARSPPKRGRQVLGKMVQRSGNLVDGD